ncbi:30S ribosomal protein S4 (mitochondrion) [Nitzschia inconspicua]|uniref:30S ribosomal protein S4 n=1 Tax=Nitzschia inconspicua TaxID=303405 RepID=A0A8H2SIJ7_9STRA|nr:30S ribosomal protein S4 [Nitzschia inconspicua]
MKYKKRYKPFYKQFLRLRQNVQNRAKLFRFKKQKWQRFQKYSENQLGFYKRFKIKDQFQLSAPKFASRGNSLQRKFKNNLYQRKFFSLFYGGLKKKYLKKSILRAISVKNDINPNLVDFRYNILRFFESRLDTVIYRISFSLSIKEASQLILHGHVLVNGQPVKSKSYLLRPNDLIEIAHSSKSRALVKKSLDKSNFWPVPPKHLLVNYKTLQVLFVYSKDLNLMPIFNHYLNLNSVIGHIKKA